MAITTVHNELIAVNAISGTAIADNAVTSVHIAQNNVGTVQIALNSVTSVSIALNQVTGTQIANNAITSTQLADNAVTATKVPDGTQFALGATTFSSSIALSGAASAGISEGLLIDWSTNLARFLTYDSSTGSEIAFYTQPNGGSTTQALRIDSSQNATFAGNITTAGFTSTGIDDNADATAITIDSNEKIIIGDTASHVADLLQIETPSEGGGHGIQIRRNDANNDQGIGHILFGNNTATDLVKISAKTDLDSNSGDSGALLFHTQVTNGNLTERMRIDSSGFVGINTAGAASYTPLTLETASGSAFAAGGVNGVGLLLRNRSSTVGTSSGIKWAANTSYHDLGGIHMVLTGNSSTNETADLTFFTSNSGDSGNTEKMRITSAGKVGIGIDPTGILHVDGHTSSVASIFEGNGSGDTVPVQLKVKANNGTTSTQGLYGNAGSASTDNTITLGANGTTGLTIDNLGNLKSSQTGGHVQIDNGVGVTVRETMAAMSHAWQANTYNVLSAGAVSIGSDSSNTAHMWWNTYDTGSKYNVSTGYGCDMYLAKATGDFVIRMGSTNAASNGAAQLLTEAFKLDKDGHAKFSQTVRVAASNNYGYVKGGTEALILGGASSSESDQTTIILREGGNYSSWLTQNTERMRILTDGEVVFNSSIADTYSPLVNGITADGFVCNRHSTAGSLGLWRTNTMEWKYYHNGQGYVMTFEADGDICGSFVSCSDENRKENISSITDGTTIIKALRPVKYDWKDSSKSNNNHGFIAQEVETVLPNAVKGNDYVKNLTGLPEDEPENNGKTINESAVLAHAVKAIQELEARIKVLEG